jgi:sugar/nucleoside kinase (ribokinase family)
MSRFIKTQYAYPTEAVVMVRKKVVIGFSGNPEVAFSDGVSLRHFTRNKKNIFDTVHFGVGGTSVDWAIGLKTLGAPVFTRLLLCVGHEDRDPNRHQLVDGLERMELDYHIFPVLEQTNFAAIHLFNGASSRISGLKGRYIRFPEKELEEQCVTIMPDVCIATGVMPQEVTMVLRLFSHGSETVLNPRPELFESATECNRVLSKTSLLVINEREHCALLGKSDYFQPSESSCRAILELGPNEVIVTNGVRGSHYGNRHGAYHHQEAIMNSDVTQDATGAGDCYAAAFLSKRFAGESIESAMLFASCAASTKLQFITGANVPEKTHVDEVFAKAKASSLRLRI